MDASLIVRAWPVCDGPSFSSPQMEADGNAVFEQEFFVPVLGQGDIEYNILYTLQVMIFSSFLLILFFAFSPFFLIPNTCGPSFLQTTGNFWFQFILNHDGSARDQAL